MSYNLTFMETSNTLPEIVEGINGASGGFFVTCFIVLVWLVLMNMAEYSLAKSLILSSFITAVISIMFSWLGWMSWNLAMIPFVFMMLGIGLYFYQDRQ